MNNYEINPFSQQDQDRYEIWEMLVRRDIDAFLAGRWDQVEDDFIEAFFFATNADQHTNPDSWKLGFPNLESYRDSWLQQSKDFSRSEYRDDPREKLFLATNARDIEVRGDRALLHKKFDGQIVKKDQTVVELHWQTLYHLIKHEGRWKIIGFIGYLPYPFPAAQSSGGPLKTKPEHASQHQTAGPYSPVLTVNPGRLVVISGQASLKDDGAVVGSTVEEQTKVTLDHCLRQLGTAGADFKNVFKVNVYLTDLSLWSRFNEVYRSVMPETLPVRTAVGTDLLPGLLVEIEMWAVIN